MAGVKGRSGGTRSGAGRKPKPRENGSPSGDKPVAVPIEGRDMLQVLMDVALGVIEVTPLQIRAAIAAVQYTHPKIGEGGKKDQKQDAANKVASRFSTASPPKLVAAGGKKV